MATSHLLALRRSASLLIIFTIIVLVQGPLRIIGFRSGYKLGHTWHKLCRWAIGMRVRYHGSISSESPTFFVANHTSYLDIPALGSLLDATFIAKSEIKSWPMFGLLCSLQRTIFIDRDWRKALVQQKQLYKRLDDRDSLILFPEGTSNNGTFTRQFKSALFSAADWTLNGQGVAVQPITIAYTRLNGIALGRRLRPLFAWYGDMVMFNHFWSLLGSGRLGVDIIFHPPVRLTNFGSRKELSKHCEQRVSNGLSDALSGRL